MTEADQDHDRESEASGGLPELRRCDDEGCSQQGFTYGDDFTQRRDTVEKLLHLVVSHWVVHVRGTPTSGKTVLSRTLYTHILEQKEYIPIYITWKLLGNSDRRKDALAFLSLR